MREATGLDRQTDNILADRDYRVPSELGPNANPYIAPERHYTWLS